MSLISDIIKRLGRLEEWTRTHGAYEPTASTCQVSQAVQSIDTGAPTNILFDTDDYDPDDLHSVMASTAQIIIKVAGVYTCSAYGLFEQHDVGERRIRITQNGIANTITGQSGNTDGATLTVDLSCSRERKLAVGDIIRLSAYQTTGAKLNILATLGVTRES